MTYVDTIDPSHLAGEAHIATATALESPDTAYEHLTELRWPDDREACWIVYVDVKHRPIRNELVSLGSLDHTFMAPREIFRSALTIPRCAAIILAHNHPSGDPEPSKDDQMVTRRISRAGEIVGIDVLDHVIVSLPDNGRWVSLARRGCV